MNFGITRAIAGVDSFSQLGRILSSSRQMRSWIDQGMPAPVPHAVKVRNIVAVAQLFSLRTLVETGTQSGATLAAAIPYFDRLYSIEIFKPSAAEARKRFADQHKVTIIEGDSAMELARLIKMIEEPVLFWLDGHYSGPGSGMGEDHSPISAEIAHILNLRPRGRDAIIIDDARLFVGKNGYPPLPDFLAQLEQSFSTKPHCADDAIFVLPY